MMQTDTIAVFALTSTWKPFEIKNKEIVAKYINVGFKSKLYFNFTKYGYGKSHDMNGHMTSRTLLTSLVACTRYECFASHLSLSAPHALVTFD